MGDFRGIEYLKPYQNYSVYRDSLIQSGDYFYLAMGRFFSSQVVEREIGGPIYNDCDTQWIIALNEENVAGFVSLYPARPRQLKGLWFDADYIVPEHRKKGLYAHLFQLRIDIAKEHKERPLRLVTYNDVVREMCQRHKFTVSRQWGKWTYYERTTL